MLFPAPGAPATTQTSAGGTSGSVGQPATGRLGNRGGIRRACGRDWADTHDAVQVDPPTAVEGLAGLVDPGSALLEYGAGTGRRAGPLADRGFDVVAVDIRGPVLQTLREKPGAERGTAVLGDMTMVELGRTFDMAFSALNSIFWLPSQEERVQPTEPQNRIAQIGDRVVITTMTRGTPPPAPTRACGCAWGDGTTAHSVGGRHVWHGELDLMARLAGLELEHRWSDWAGSPFTAASRGHTCAHRRP